MTPILTWFINDDAIQKEAYVGSFQSTDVFHLSVTVINNYLGIDIRESIKNGRLMIMFKDYEDSALLSAINVKFDGSYNVPLEITGDRAYAKIPRVILGDYSYEKDCRLDIELSIKQNLVVKSDLKQLILDIVY